MNHLFGLAMAYVNKNAKLSRFYMIKGFEVAEKYRIEVPEAVLSRVCRKCRCIQIPNKNCKVRVRTRSSRSPINRRRKKKSSSSGKVTPMLRNEIVSVCAMCDFETSLQNEKKKKNPMTKRKREPEKNAKNVNRSKGMQKKKKKKSDDRTQNSTKNSSSLLNFLQNFKT